MHLDTGNIIRRRQDGGDLDEATIWNNGDKHQVGAWSKVSEQVKNQSLISVDRSAIGPKGTSIVLSEAVRRHNRKNSKTKLDKDLKAIVSAEKVKKTAVNRKESRASSQARGKMSL